jgi:hypothetical protein
MLLTFAAAAAACWPEQFQLLDSTADNCSACANLNKTAARDSCITCLKDFPTLTGAQHAGVTLLQ